ncbi:hypothetical protein DXG01_005031 [Tephrocybe rancida]|nr:hypothetical protein DXG01_005031 [Tephrocybe rancida]
MSGKANLLGSSIARLYRPLETSLSDLEDFEDEAGTQLLPIHSDSAPAPKGHQYKSPRLTDVWDEREEVFGVGSDDDDDMIPGPATLGRDVTRGPIPKISVSGP